MRYRLIRKYGNTHVIVLTKADVKDFEIKAGQEVEVEDMMVNKRKKKRK